jgi:hypothetical protein
MYSGSTFNKYSGQVLGAHQKIDRVARRHLEKLVPNSKFPSLKEILSFEGDKGPDAIKRKSPAKDEPWHYFQPYETTDEQLIKLIEGHYRRLAEYLKQGDDVRAAFEAAWLAHALVDGLTPAHHYPYEEKLVELRGGLGIADRTTISKKLIIPGNRRRDMALNNWKMWGPKGLFTTHAAFEIGVATLIAPLKMHLALPTADKIEAFQAQSLALWFRRQAQSIYDLELYDIFCESGWTLPLARQVRTELAPALVRAVTLVWYGAALEAGLTEAV